MQRGPTGPPPAAGVRSRAPAAFLMELKSSILSARFTKSPQSQSQEEKAKTHLSVNVFVVQKPPVVVLLELSNV